MSKRDLVLVLGEMEIVNRGTPSEVMKPKLDTAFLKHLCGQSLVWPSKKLNTLQKGGPQRSFWIMIRESYYLHHLRPAEYSVQQQFVGQRNNPLVTMVYGQTSRDR
jgi:hypothetical protein